MKFIEVLNGFSSLLSLLVMEEVLRRDKELLPYQEQVGDNK